MSWEIQLITPARPCCWCTAPIQAYSAQRLSFKGQKLGDIMRSTTSTYSLHVYAILWDSDDQQWHPVKIGEIFSHQVKFLLRHRILKFGQSIPCSVEPACHTWRAVVWRAGRVITRTSMMTYLNTIRPMVEKHPELVHPSGRGTSSAGWIITAQRWS